MNDMKEKAMGAVKAFLERKGYEIVDEAWQGPEGIGGIDLVAGLEAASASPTPPARWGSRGRPPGSGSPGGGGASRSRTGRAGRRRHRGPRRPGGGPRSWRRGSP